MGAEGWTAFDEGFLNAHEWGRALAGGAALPQAAAPVQLGPGEVAHARIAPVGISGYFGEDKQYRSSFFLIGGPVGLVVTGAASLAHNASKRADAQRAAVPRWHQLGTAEIVVTNQRLIAIGSGRTESLWYAEIGPPSTHPRNRRRAGRAVPAGGQAPHPARSARRPTALCSCTTSSTDRLLVSRCPPGCSNAPDSRGAFDREAHEGEYGVPAWFE